MSDATSVVLFGAGRYAAESFERLKCQYDPVAFGDNDAKKHGSIFLGLPVLPLGEIESRYPGCLYFVTVFSTIKLDVIDSLVCVGIAPERIINFEEYRKYSSCINLEMNMFHSPNSVECQSLAFCCSDFGQNRSPIIDISASTHEEAIRSFFEERDRIIGELNAPAKGAHNNPCSGCIKVKHGPWRTDRRIHYLNFSYRSLCNFKCKYCHQPHHKIDHLFYKSVEDALSFLCFLRQKNYINDQTLISSGTGEISVHPMRDKILQVLRNYPCWLSSNASVYNDTIAEIISKEGSKIIVSLDAGTRETFASIKGVDLFDKVCSNLSQYAQKGSVELKYIFLPGTNDNERDVSAFLAICSRMNVKNVIVSRDNHDKGSLGDRTIVMIAALIRGARELGIGTFVPEECFAVAPQDGLRLADMLAGRY